MGSKSKRGNSGDRVLEGRHVIGLFLVMLLFSGVFFALGFVMGRSQYDGQVRADLTPKNAPSIVTSAKADAKHKSDIPQPDSGTAENNSGSSSSDWDFYKSGKDNAPDTNLKPVQPEPVVRPVVIAAKPKEKPAAKTIPAKLNAPAIPGGAYLLQVAALRTQADALALANNLQKKKFPAFVLSPQSDTYYRVQVGPYADQKAANAARKGLDGAGFKAIVKH